MRDARSSPVRKKVAARCAVLAHCRASLAPFKAPKRVVFAETLPKNPSGKLLKRELRQSHEALFPRD